MRKLSRKDDFLILCVCVCVNRYLIVLNEIYVYFLKIYVIPFTTFFIFFVVLVFILFLFI